MLNYGPGGKVTLSQTRHERGNVPERLSLAIFVSEIHKVLQLPPILNPSQEEINDAVAMERQQHLRRQSRKFEKGF